MSLEKYSILIYYEEVILTGKSEILAFQRKHPDSRKALRVWQDIVEKNSFKDFEALKSTFPSVDFIKGTQYTAFDVRGNKYRLIALVIYRFDRCIVERIMTHPEYERWLKRI